MIYTINSNIITHNGKTFNRFSSPEPPPPPPGPPDGMYYFTNFEDIQTDIYDMQMDNPIYSKDGFKWVMQTNNFKMLGDIGTITNINGSLPSSYKGHKYRIINDFLGGEENCTEAMQFPSNKDFCWQFWMQGLETDDSGIEILGVKFPDLYESTTNTIFIYFGENDYPCRGRVPWEGVSYPTVMRYNSSTTVTGETNATTTVCTSRQWHHYAIENDLTNKHTYFFSDGIIRLDIAGAMKNMSELGIYFPRVDSFWKRQLYLTEFIVWDKCLSTGTGANRRFPVPTTPIVI